LTVHAQGGFAVAMRKSRSTTQRFRASVPPAGEGLPAFEVLQLRLDDCDLRAEDLISEDPRTRDAIHAKGTRLALVDVASEDVPDGRLHA